MPVFHTKTIESILEPVAQQVSKLVILHEEADDGNKMPDLSLPVNIVKLAADNLIKVGFETVETSDDLILQKELPSALKRVQQACDSLQAAAVILKKGLK
jgi:vinculin